MADADAALVLVVDDEPGVRLVLEGMLRQLGYRVAQAEAARPALALLVRQPIDVVITDLKMPGEDGLWLLGQVRASSAFVPVIVATAHGSIDVAVEAMRAGAFDFLTKPVEREALRLALQKAVPVSARLDDTAGGVTLVAESSALRAVLKLCERMAPSSAAVLITGPSGTGKEVVARALHQLRGGPARPFVAVSCGAIPEALLESELFGHQKGAFTGATCDKPGRVELAQGGTLFLDEIGELPLAMQVKLLRLVQERTYERVGGLGTRSADVRVVAATHRDLGAMVAAGTFREDLLFRLNVLPIAIPPLRERPDDIAPLARAFLARAAQQTGRATPQLEATALQHLTTLPWPGNARELGNLMERVATLCDGPTIGIADLERCRCMGLSAPSVTSPTAATLAPGLPSPCADERQLLVDTLARAAGNRTLAAKLLGVSRRTLYYRLERHGLQ